jgi:hypothetical protein
MRATEMHDLLRDAYEHVAHATSLFEPGDDPAIRHILYCNFCNFSQAWIDKHGHGDKCLYARLKDAVTGVSESE